MCFKLKPSTFSESCPSSQHSSSQSPHSQRNFILHLIKTRNIWFLQNITLYCVNDTVHPLVRAVYANLSCTTLRFPWLPSCKKKPCNLKYFAVQSWTRMMDLLALSIMNTIQATLWNEFDTPGLTHLDWRCSQLATPALKHFLYSKWLQDYPGWRIPNLPVLTYILLLFSA